MGRFTFKLPDIGEGIAEAEIVAWHVAVGDAVAEDGRLADMMTDKATVEMESPVAGRVVEVAGAVGDTVAIGSPLVVIETEAEESSGAPAPTSDAFEERIEVENPDAGDVERTLGAEADATPSTSSQSTEVVPDAASEPKSFVAPRSASTCRKPCADPRPTGQVARQPRVCAPARAISASTSPKSARARTVASAMPISTPFSPTMPVAASYPPGGAWPTSRWRVIGLRRRIADAMSASKRHIPHFSYVEECDVTALEETRAQLNAGAVEGRPRLTLLPLLITAICRALPGFPMLNARYDDEAGVVTRAGAVHMGVATQTPAGLMVPVIRDAQDRNLWQLAGEIARLAAAARDGSAKSEELSGSTLTVTSLGALGGVATTPVINRPEVAIIGPNRIVDRPMFVPDGAGGERIAKRKLMNLSISCDHRVVDGWDAASFVQEVRRLLENPALLLVA